MVDTLHLWYLPVAVGLGALHALEPGHAKTMIAAYLIGTRGTKRDALMLGVSAAATHSLVVIGLAVAGLWLGSQVVTGSALRWLQLGSGLLVIALGLWMLVRRLRPRPHAHHHEPDPIAVEASFGAGTLRIVDTPEGERMRLSLQAAVPGLAARVAIARAGGRSETIDLVPEVGRPGDYLSVLTPDEPHEFHATLTFTQGERSERIAFAMHEPAGHQHGEHEDDAAHAAAHARDMPAYVQRGERPTLGQVVAFGAAGGLMPCPASVTVMLLALSVGKAVLGFIAVMCFSLGLAITMVGLGMAVVYGAQRLASSPRLTWFSRRAPAISACAILLSGCASVALAARPPS
jgi:nickel/cobalt exporter